MDDTPIDEAVAPTSLDGNGSPGQAERASDLAILEGLEVELAEVEAALQRLDGTDTDPAAAPHFDPQP